MKDKGIQDVGIVGPKGAKGKPVKLDTIELAETKADLDETNKKLSDLAKKDADLAIRFADKQQVFKSIIEQRTKTIKKYFKQCSTIEHKQRHYDRIILWFDLILFIAALANLIIGAMIDWPWFVPISTVIVILVLISLLTSICLSLNTLTKLYGLQRMLIVDLNSIWKQLE